MTTPRFGELARALRVERRLTLRQFCREAGLDPGYVSKIERGLLAPPQSREKLEHYARQLGLEPGSDVWISFMDLAAATAGKLPEDLADDAFLMESLPILFRTIRGQPVDSEKLDELIALIRQGGRR